MSLYQNCVYTVTGKYYPAPQYFKGILQKYQDKKMCNKKKYYWW